MQTSGGIFHPLDLLDGNVGPSTGANESGISVSDLLFDHKCLWHDVSLSLSRLISLAPLTNFLTDALSSSLIRYQCSMYRP